MYITKLENGKRLYPISTKKILYSCFHVFLRYFCPWYGVLEHSVTGSAHAVLGPYWSPIVGKTDMFARQCSKRGGELRVKVFDNEVGMCGQGPVIVDGTIEV